MEKRLKTRIFDTTMDQSLKVTCLHNSHISLGAKMSPFAGFDMPIQYSGIIQEHNAVRNAAGMFDVSHMGEIVVDGPDAEAFVNHVFTNDVRPLAAGGILYGMMCYPDGGVVDDLLVYKEFEQQHYLLVVNASNVDKDYAWLREQSEAFDVRLDDQLLVLVTCVKNDEERRVVAARRIRNGETMEELKALAEKSTDR